jgi:nucleotide-binding universal stress UspA family protein
MINKILIPIDFSEVANNALQYAIQLAKKTHAEIHILYVKNIPIMDNSFPNNVYHSYLIEVEEFTKKSFDDLTEKVLKNAEVKFETHTVFGFIKDEIQDFSDKNNIDLIVLGTKGASGMQEILIGSNAASVAANSTIPVLIIPPHARFEKLIHLVYATDYNEPEFPAVARLTYFANLYDADVSVLHVKSDYDEFFDAEHNFFSRNKDADEFKKWKIIKLPKGESVIESINTFITNNHSNMIVMAKHNRNFFDRLFHISLSKKMAYHTQIPLLVLNK